MDGVAFVDLAKSAKFREFHQIVRELTGVRVVLADVDTGRRELLFPPAEVNPVCALLERHPACAAACVRSVKENCALAAQGKAGTSYLCHAGLIDMVAPVFVGERHVASFIGGQVLPEPPSEAGFARLAARLAPHRLDAAELRAAYFQHPHMDKAKVECTLKLLRFFAEYFHELGSLIKEEAAAKEHLALRRVKEHIREHLAEPLPLRLLAKRAGLSGPYLSVLFKRATGKNLSSHIWEARVEAAKKALERSDRKIIQIAFDVGFGSLAQFNRTFKKLTGLSPSEHRAGHGRP